MANEEQVEILKQGVNIWNKWRKDNPNIRIDLVEAELGESNLREADLREADLGIANLVESNLREADLSRANLSGANLSGADLSGANLEEAFLSKTNLMGALLVGSNLKQADLSGTNLIENMLFRRGMGLGRTDFRGAYLVRADLRRANLSGVNLRGVDLSEADLNEANLTESWIGNTIFANNDLSVSLGLETARHSRPSTVGTDTIRRSKGMIPVGFLRGCGLSDWEIETAKLYNPELSNKERNETLYKIYDLQIAQAIQISPLFISYSHADSPFVDKLERLLNDKGIRFWRDIHDATAGRLEKQIDHAIRLNPTVLLVLSKNSIASDWVEHEVSLARKLEKEIGRDVLCPIALDDSWKQSSWSEPLVEQVMKYYILDCSCWENEDKFRHMFDKLVDGLNLYYKKD